MFALSTVFSRHVSGSIYNRSCVPTREYSLTSQYGGMLDIEIHLIRGETVTGFEFPEPGKLRVVIQMGMPKEHLVDHCSKAIEPALLQRVLKLWTDPNHPRSIVESGRNLIIRENA